MSYAEKINFYLEGITEKTQIYPLLHFVSSWGEGF